MNQLSRRDTVMRLFSERVTKPGAKGIVTSSSIISLTLTGYMVVTLSRRTRNSMLDGHIIIQRAKLSFEISSLCGIVNKNFSILRGVPSGLGLGKIRQGIYSFFHISEKM